MSRSENEESIPLVYEDRAVSEITAQQRRRKWIWIALTTACIGVGLSLAIALPLTAGADGDGASQGSDPSMLLNSGNSHGNSYEQGSFSTAAEEDMTTVPPTGASSAAVPTSASSTVPPTSASSTALPTSASSTSLSSLSPSTSETTSDSSSYTSSTRQPITSTFPGPPGPFDSCPYVPATRRSSVDLKELNGKLLFEIYRVQSSNSPTMTSGLTCSMAEFDLGPTDAVDTKNGTIDATLKLQWIETGFFTRYQRKLQVKLEGTAKPPFDWTETVGNNTGAQSQISLLVVENGYLLTYECFPNATFFPRPAYAIRLYSLLPWRVDTWFAEALLTLANVWGLNPAEERVLGISQRYCSLENRR